jgi:hypothetical protein
VSFAFCRPRFVPHPPKFLGALSLTGEPQARAVFSSFARVFFHLRHDSWRCTGVACTARPIARVIMRCRRLVGRTARGEMGSNELRVIGWMAPTPPLCDAERGVWRCAVVWTCSLFVSIHPLSGAIIHDADIARSRTPRSPTRFGSSETRRSAWRPSGRTARPRWCASLTSPRRRASATAMSRRRATAVVVITSRRSVRKA